MRNIKSPKYRIQRGVVSAAVVLLAVVAVAVVVVFASGSDTNSAVTTAEAVVPSTATTSPSLGPLDHVLTLITPDTAAPEPEPVGDPFQIGEYVARGNIGVDGGAIVTATAWVAITPNYIVTRSGGATFDVSLDTFTWHLLIDASLEEAESLATDLSSLQLSQRWPSTSTVCSVQGAVNDAGHEVGFVSVRDGVTTEQYCELRFKGTGILAPTQADGDGQVRLDFTQEGVVYQGIDSNLDAQLLVDELIDPPAIVVVQEATRSGDACRPGDWQRALILEGTADLCVTSQR